jgi:hypothetical protein
MMSTPIDRLKERIATLRTALVNHPINSFIQSPAELEVFMEHHVFAVWDFMSLVKKLQQEFTCVELPWNPKGTAEVRYLINEIVLGEESDVDQHGVYISHFELYLRAMEELSFMPSPFLHELRSFASLDELLLAIPKSNIPDSVKQFLTFTFSAIQHRTVEEVAAIFTFGREDIIPEMFQVIVDQLKKEAPDKIETLVYYLERHIEVDGGHHSEIAYRMMEHLCGEDETKWEKATQAAVDSLQVRLKLWDGIVEHKA